MKTNLQEHESHTLKSSQFKDPSEALHNIRQGRNTTVVERDHCCRHFLLDCIFGNVLSHFFLFFIFVNISFSKPLTQFETSQKSPKFQQYLSTYFYLEKIKLT